MLLNNLNYISLKYLSLTNQYTKDVSILKDPLRLSLLKKYKNKYRHLKIDIRLRVSSGTSLDKIKEINKRRI